MDSLDWLGIAYFGTMILSMILVKPEGILSMLYFLCLGSMGCILGITLMIKGFMGVKDKQTQEKPYSKKS